MNTRILFIAVALILAFTDQEGEVAFLSSFNPKIYLSDISGNRDYLFVMAAGKIFQYEITRMELVRTVELPDLPIPQDGHPSMKNLSGGPQGEKGPCPSTGWPPHGLWAGGNCLHVMTGPVIYRYSLPDLRLDAYAECSQILSPPSVGKRGGQYRLPHVGD